MLKIKLYNIISMHFSTKIVIFSTFSCTYGFFQHDISNIERHPTLTFLLQRYTTYHHSIQLTLQFLNLPQNFNGLYCFLDAKRTAMNFICMFVNHWALDFLGLHLPLLTLFNPKLLLTVLKIMSQTCVDVLKRG